MADAGDKALHTVGHVIDHLLKGGHAGHARKMKSGRKKTMAKGNPRAAVRGVSLKSSQAKAQGAMNKSRGKRAAVKKSKSGGSKG